MEYSEQYELMKQGKSYHFDSFLYAKQKQCAKSLLSINSLPFGSGRREKLFRKLLGSYGHDNVIKDGFHCNFGFNITIGDRCYINYGVTILDSYKVNIANNVFIGPHAVISSVTHPNIAEKRRELIIGEVTIEDDVWIGANAVILPGVTLHKGAVVGAGALVKEDVEAGTVVGGVPAKFIKKVY